RALAGVRVADERHDGNVALATPRPPLLAPGALGLEHPFEAADPVANPPTVDLELLLAGSAPSDPAHQPRQARVAAAHEPRKQVLELRQLHLDLPLPRLGAPREDVQDELGAIEDLEVGRLRDGARLRGRQVLIDHDEVRLEPRRADDEVLEPARA